MGAREIRLTRRELYDLVWSKPLSLLAQELPVSDVGLAKICKRLNIPRPSQGYWTRRRTRHGTVKPPPLPSTAEACEREVVLRGLESEYPRKEPSEPPEVVVPDTLENLHPLIARTARGLERAEPDRHCILRPRGKSVLAIEVTEAARNRSLRLLDSLVKALEERGHKVDAGSEFRPKTLVEVAGEAVSISLKEQMKRSTHELTLEEEEQEARRGWSWAPRFDYAPSGLLRFRVSDLEGTGFRQSWSDGKRSRLEEKLGQVVVGIEAAAAFQRARRLERAAERERWEQEWAIREAAFRRQEEERRFLEEFRAMARDWADVSRMREFVQVVESSTPTGDRGSNLVAWLVSAHLAIQKLDPLSRISRQSED